MNLKVACEFEVATVVGYHRFFNASNCLLLQVKSSVVHANRAVILWIWPFPFLTCLIHDRHGVSPWTSISMTYDHISRPLLAHVKAHLCYMYSWAVLSTSCSLAFSLLSVLCIYLCMHISINSYMATLFVFFRLRICRHRHLCVIDIHVYTICLLPNEQRRISSWRW